MKSIWCKHLVICLFFGLAAIPIYFWDVASTRERGGGAWITLDFRGLIFWTYITLFAIHVALSSLAVLSFPKSGVLRIHLCSIVLAVILFGMGFAVYGKLLRDQAISAGEEAPTGSAVPGDGAIGGPPQACALRRYNLFAALHARSRWRSLI